MTLLNTKNNKNKKNGLKFREHGGLELIIKYRKAENTNVDTL